MAETVPTIAATNFFSLGAEFGIRVADTSEFKSFAPIFDASGDYLCSEEYDEGDTYTNEADYCGGGSPDIVTDLGTLLTTFGAAANSKQPTAQEIGFSSGIPATVKIDGHQHDSNPHTALANYDCSGIIPAGSGVGVPTLITVAGTVSPVNATVGFEIEHIDKPGADGTHFEGQNMRCRVSLSIDYAGQVSGVTAGDWLNIVVAKSNPNDDTPTCTLTAEQWIDAN